MRDRLLSVLALSLFSSICEFLLPEGKLRRFVTPLLHLAVTASILLPVVSLLRTDNLSDSLLPVFETVPAEMVYAESVEAAYKEKLAEKIGEKGGVVTEIEVDDRFAIRRIVLSHPVPTEAMFYITTTLEVPRNHVEIR